MTCTWVNSGNPLWEPASLQLVLFFCDPRLVQQNTLTKCLHSATHLGIGFAVQKQLVYMELSSTSWALTSAWHFSHGREERTATK